MIRGKIRVPVPFADRMATGEERRRVDARSGRPHKRRARRQERRAARQYIDQARQEMSA